MSKPKTIIWLSRHKPLPSQLRELNKRFGQHRLILDHRTFDGADDIIARARAHNADEIVAVLPTTIALELSKRGIKPIKAHMVSVPCPAGEVRIGSRRRPRCYYFSHFRRIDAFELKDHPLSEESNEP